MRFVLFAVAFCCAPLALANEAEVRAAYAKLRQAMMSKNIAAVSAMCAPNLQWKQAGKTASLADLKNQMQMQFQVTKKYDELSFKFNKITIKGNTAVVDCQNVVRCDVMIPGQKKVSKIVSKSRSVDTWTKGPKGWIVKIVDVKSETTSIDGKTVSGG